MKNNIIFSVNESTTETDLINLALFGTCEEKTDISTEELMVLCNLKYFNYLFIESGVSKGERLKRLCNIAIYYHYKLIFLGAHGYN